MSVEYLDSRCANTIAQKIEAQNWAQATEQLHQDGYALLPQLLTTEQCEMLKQLYTDPSRYRKTVNMQRYRFGAGEYKYFHYPLPELLQQLRQQIYPYLAPIANDWFRVLGIERDFPSAHEMLLQQCHDAGQNLATVLTLKYGAGGYNTLHQDLYGEVYFPMQLVINLSAPEQDYYWW